MISIAIILIMMASRVCEDFTVVLEVCVQSICVALVIHIKKVITSHI